MAVELGPFAAAVMWTAVYFENGFDILSKIFSNFVSHFTCAILSSFIKYFVFVFVCNVFTVIYRSV
jgi:hypothetical protein